jgi:hypothetical protein
MPREHWLEQTLHASSSTSVDGRYSTKRIGRASPPRRSRAAARAVALRPARCRRASRSTAARRGRAACSPRSRPRCAYSGRALPGPRDHRMHAWRRPIRRSRRGCATRAHHRARAHRVGRAPLVFRPRRPAARPPRRGGTAPLRLPCRGARWRGRVGREQRLPGGPRSRQRTRAAQRRAGAPPGRR